MSLLFRSARTVTAVLKRRRQKLPLSFEASTLTQTYQRRAYVAANADATSWTVDPVTGIVKDALGKTYQTIVGLEVHAQLHIPDKLFSSAASNGAIHPFDVAVPGTLPRLSATAVQKAVLVAAALNCDISNVSRFERKHYTYADLPHSYQMTQQRWPLAVNGHLECPYLPQKTQSKKKNKSQLQQQQLKETIRCGIERIQLEQDTGKTISTTRSSSEGNTRIQTTYSRVDFARAGCALVEIVMKPDLRSSLQAASVVHALRQLLRFTQTCGGKMEEGQLRVDCNINLQDNDNNQLRTPRIEVKNLNSIQQVQDAVQYEAMRQADLFSQSDWGMEETRTWDVVSKRTVLIRRKDQAPDYRFMPEPDLPPLVLNEKVLEGLSLDDFVSNNLPELPAAAEERLQSTFGLTDYQAHVISRDRAAIQLFEEAMSTVENSIPKNDPRTAKTTANLLCNELFALVNESVDQHILSENRDADYEVVSMTHSKVTGQQLGEIVELLLEETLSTTMAKKLLTILFLDNNPCTRPRALAQTEGLQLIRDQEKLRSLCRTVIKEHPEEVKVYRRGGKFVIKMKKLFTGKAMALSQGNAHPERLRDALEEILEEVAPGVQ